MTAIHVYTMWRGTLANTMVHRLNSRLFSLLFPPPPCSTIDLFSAKKHREGKKEKGFSIKIVYCKMAGAKTACLIRRLVRCRNYLHHFNYLLKYKQTMKVDRIVQVNGSSVEIFNDVTARNDRKCCIFYDPQKYSTK